MAVKIKLKRMGKIRSPHYRIIVADSRTRRDGRAIEEIGLYNPMTEPSLIKVNSERAQYWLGVGAQPTEPVMAILRVTGDWQTFKGLPGAEGTLKVADAKADKRAAFDAALAEVHGEPKSDATTAKKKTAKKSAAKKDDAKSGESKSDESKSDESKGDSTKTESKKDEAAAKAEDAVAEAPADAADETLDAESAKPATEAAEPAAENKA